MSDPISESYDELPYTCHAFACTHPGRLAFMAELSGVHAPAVENCRVLELGCGIGGNLLPMAESLPGGEFVGIDLSPKQIEIGRKMADEAGLKNIDLRVAQFRNWRRDCVKRWIAARSSIRAKTPRSPCIPSVWKT